MKFQEFINDQKIFDNGYENNSPLVSIVMPTYCRMAEGFLKRCIESVLIQTYTNFEFIIVDDGSTDGSQELIIQYAQKDKRIIYIRHDINCGLPAVRTNEGIMKARGQYVAFIFDDNIWDPLFLETLLNEMHSNPADVQYSITKMKVDEDQHFLLGEWPLTFEILYHLNTIPNGSVLCKRSFFEQYGLYDPHIGMRRLCDWDLWFRAKLLGASFNYVNKILSTELGPSSPVSLGLSVKMDYKLTYAYMTDEKVIYERTKKLLPNTIDHFDVFNFNVLLPYLKNYDEYLNVENIVYKPFFEGHTYYSNENIFNNRLFSVNDNNQLSPFKNELGLHRKLRILLVCNVYNDKIAKYKDLLQLQHSNSIVITCGEWQLSSYSPTDIDFLIMVDCTGLFMTDFIRQYQEQNVPILYFISYGLQRNSLTNVLDYNQLECVQNVFKKDLYFPKLGLPWNDTQLQAAIQLMDLSDLVVNFSDCDDNFIKTTSRKLQLQEVDFSKYIIQTGQLLKNINNKRCFIFLNSSMISGSEIYGVQIGKMLHSVGIDVQICVPDEKNYGDDENDDTINKYIQDLGLKPIIKAPYNSRNRDNVYLESLLNWVSTQEIGLIVCSSYIDDIVSVASTLDIHSVFALFQPTGYRSEKIKELKNAASCIISDSDWAAKLYNKAFDLTAIKIPTIVNNQSLVKIKKDAQTISIAIGGTLQKRKRQLEAVKACHLLIRQGYNIELNIYGYKLQMLTSYVEDIQTYIENNELNEKIRLHGLVPMDEIVSNNDIILSTSVDESIPQTLLICAAGGLIPVACPAGGIPEFIIDGVTGYLTKDFDTTNIYETLQKAIENKENWLEISDNIKDLIDKAYSFDVVRSKLLGHLILKTSTPKHMYNFNTSSTNYDLIQEVNHSLTPRIIDVNSISFSRPITKLKKYKFNCTLNQLSAIGIIFGTLNEKAYAGTIQMALFSKGRKLRDSVIDISTIRFNNWNYFKFEPLLNCLGNEFTIELSFKCEYKGIGTFENKHRRNYLYKLLNRLNIYLPIVDLLYIDLKE
ncbi:glycosyltransferase [Paenibacillus sp. FSL W8-0187]|uniref:glycosyltransferase n=1 Tax=Paenibacillus sp. FSL W8-0187 TaxID=2921710 RepID=UPI0030DA6408